MKVLKNITTIAVFLVAILISMRAYSDQIIAAKPSVKVSVDEKVVTSEATTGTKTFSILGDSWSTFQGSIPKDYASYYPKDAMEEGNDVYFLTDTWFKVFSEMTGFRLLVNNSASGSRIMRADSDPRKPSMLDRVDNLGDPDMIIVFGGINDYWKGEDLESEFIPALSEVLELLTVVYSGKKIVYICNYEFPEAWHARIHEVCNNRQIQLVSLPQVPMIDGHPTKEGLKMIAQTIANEVVNTWE